MKKIEITFLESAIRKKEDLNQKIMPVLSNYLRKLKNIFRIAICDMEI